MLVHCNLKFRPEETWFLINTEDFANRRLEIGICPVCERKLARLVETRIVDNVTFDETVSRRKANRLINSLKSQVSYSSMDMTPTKSSLFGWRYGINQERTYKDGTVKTTQKAADFYGTTETIRTDIKKSSVDNF
mgnify:CR=1 FL=1